MSAKKVTKFTNDYILKSIARHAANPKLPRERITEQLRRGDRGALVSGLELGPRRRSRPARMAKHQRRHPAVPACDHRREGAGS